MPALMAGLHPDVPSATLSASRPMRSYVRRWINEWDLKRLYPDQAIETVENELTIDYTESRELEQTTDDPIGQASDDQ